MRAAGAACDCDCCCRSAFRLDVIGGYRYYGLSDNVSVQEQLVTLVPLAGGEQINITDSFRTRNFFNGSELGLIADYYHGRWSLEASAKMSMGWNHERHLHQRRDDTHRAERHGGSQPPPPPNGGLLGLYTNNGSYSQEIFMVIPEFGMQIGYQFTARLRPLSATTSSIGPRWRVPPTRSICSVNDQNIPGSGVANPVQPRPDVHFQHHQLLGARHSPGRRVAVLNPAAWGWRAIFVPRKWGRPLLKPVARSSGSAARGDYAGDGSAKSSTGSANVKNIARMAARPKMQQQTVARRAQVPCQVMGRRD